jgi:hypothetical protein
MTMTAATKGSGTQQLLECVCSRTPEAPGQAPQQIDIDRCTCSLERVARIGEILRVACETLHRDEVLATDHAKRAAKEGHRDRAREGPLVEAAQTRQQINPIAMFVADGEKRWYRVIGIPGTQLDVEIRPS